MLRICRKFLRIVIVLWPPLGQTVCSFFLVTVPVGEKACLIFLLSWNSIHHSNLFSLRKSIMGS